jgi:hypothetical protein
VSAGSTGEGESAYRCLVLAMIQRAIRDLRLSSRRYEAADWLAHDGREWAEMIDINIEEALQHERTRHERKRNATPTSNRSRRRRSRRRHQ